MHARISDVIVQIEISMKNIRKRKTHRMENLDEVTFEMIGDDYNTTKKQLDSVRSKHTKFVCINDNMKHPAPNLLQMLQEFYESFFPHQSSFELPIGEVNKFAYINEYREENRKKITHKQYIIEMYTVAFLFGIVVGLPYLLCKIRQ